MKTKKLLDKITDLPFAVIYSVMYLDYDGMTANFYIIGGYNSESDAWNALRKQANKSQKKHLNFLSSTSYISEVYRIQNTIKKGIKYLDEVGWVIDDGTGYNKIRGQVVVIKKAVGKELNSSLFKNIGPFGVDECDVESFFNSDEIGTIY